MQRARNAGESLTPQTRRLLKKYRDHREGVLRSWARRVAETDAVTSVERPNEDPGPPPLLPSGWGGREPPRSLAPLDVALAIPAGRRLRCGSLALPTVAPCTSSTAFSGRGPGREAARDLMAVLGGLGPGLRPFRIRARPQDPDHDPEPSKGPARTSSGCRGVHPPVYAPPGTPP